MVNLHLVLLVALACVCFLIAAVPHGINLRFEWLAAACLTLTLLL